MLAVGHAADALNVPENCRLANLVVGKSMVIIEAHLSAMGAHGTNAPAGRRSMSLVLDNGDIHHFFSLSDGVHYSSTRRFRGRYRAAVSRELARPHAMVVDGGEYLQPSGADETLAGGAIERRGQRGEQPGRARTRATAMLVGEDC